MEQSEILEGSLTLFLELLELLLLSRSPLKEVVLNAKKPNYHSPEILI